MMRSMPKLAEPPSSSPATKDCLMVPVERKLSDQKKMASRSEWNLNKKTQKHVGVSKNRGGPPKA